MSRCDSFPRIQSPKTIGLSQLMRSRSTWYECDRSLPPEINETSTLPRSSFPP
ncbi:MAG: hypothetical protein VKJ46_15940 [Leptolyngbyaceae bacterium]|nr:hypothetical protein [Leptolyngbyaceae bacterium]